ncbi:MAG: DUF3160 domain-containing protein [Promethearchaeota archaeon]|jgi:hypothetical protein
MGRKRNLFIIVFTLFLISAQSYEILVSNINSSSSEPLYYNLIANTFELTNSETSLLEKNKFVVLNRMGTEDILDAFKFYWINDLPIFITTDTMLHTWHLIFDHTLENLEEKIFYPLLTKLGGTMISNALPLYDSQISGDTLIYLIVASELANSTYSEEIPLDIKHASEKILNAIRDEISLDSAISQLNMESIKRFIDDFSQYKPRGHYTHSETLEQYFRLFKWFSRIPFFFDDYPGEGYLDKRPKEMIRSSLEVTWLLKETTIDCFGNIITGLEIWNIFKSFLDIIVGQTNSISPIMLDDICKNLIGDSWNIGNVDDNILSQIQDEVINDTTIPKPKSPYIIDARAGASCSPKTFVLFGERLTLDSYALNHFVYPYVSILNKRLLPTSLDFAAACLESERSFDLLEPEFDEYPDLLGQILEMQEELNNITGVEKQTVHWQWIESLKDIALSEPECNETIIIPEFMVSSAWLDEKLTTIMGSWTQLKHDTILYSKQSITPFVCCTPTGYVEPYPEFYRKLRELSQLYDSSIAPLETIGYDFNEYDYYYLRVLEEFGNATQILETIAIKELTGISLNHEERQFINSTYGENPMCGGPFVDGWLSDIIKKLDSAYHRVDNFPNSRTSLVADIHTDTNTGDILHLATGLLEPIIAFVPGWDNEDITVVGPVFSFYEFALPGYQRLNDEEWRGILALWLNGKNRESYNFGIFPRGFWAESYMVSTEITTNRIFIDEEKFILPKWFAGEEKGVLKQNPVPFFIIGPICIVVVVVAIKKKDIIKNWKLKRKQ